MNYLLRKADKELERWYSSPSRSPLVIFGPRQSGKTTLARNFAKKNYPENTIEINFYKDLRNTKMPGQSASIFKESQNPKEILTALSLIIGRKIDVAKDILLLDEIQECGEAYEVLKNFKDDYPKFPIIVTGSYLQLFLSLKNEIRHPVGCTTEMMLRPLSFEEFLQNYNSMLFSEYEKINLFTTKISSILHTKMLEALNTYLFTGGMPEVVFNFLNMYKDSLVDAVSTAREKQLDLLKQYKRDLEKYAKTSDIRRIKTIFDKIPFYLEKQQDEVVDRIRFNDFNEKKYSSLKSSFDYLRVNGLMIQSYMVNEPTFPLLLSRDKQELNHFKMYFFDVGLLNAALDCPYQQLFNKDMGHYKGYIVENFIAEQLINYINLDHLFCYKTKSSSNAAEVEFLMPYNGEIIPIEVKSSAKYSRSKSLQSYIQKYSPKNAFKCCLGNLNISDKFITIPLYLVEKIFTQDHIR